MCNDTNEDIHMEDTTNERNKRKSEEIPHVGYVMCPRKLQGWFGW